MVRMIVVAACSLAVFSAHRTGQVGHRRSICRDAEEFCGIYNRKDADGMAAVFAEDGIRERPTATWILRRYHCSRRRPSNDHGRDRDDCRAWTVMT